MYSYAPRRGHAGNALPQTARATINCRILPDEAPDAVLRTTQTVIADDSVIVTPSASATLGSLSRVEPAILDKVSKIVATLWPGVPVVPTMEPFGSDGRFLRAAGIRGIPYRKQRAGAGDLARQVSAAAQITS